MRVRGVSHEGLVSDRLGADGEPTVLHKSRRRGVVAEEPFGVFAQGRPVVAVGFLGSDEPRLVVERARARVGEPWTPFENCQHFVRECHRVRASSPDVEKAYATAMVVAGAALAVAAVRVSVGRHPARLG